MENDFLNNCTLLVNTCDGYSDCWDGFFKLLKIQWPSFSLPTVLNTESKSYSCEGLDIRVVNSKKKNAPWGKRLINALKSIDTKYVLFALEDFYLEGPVDEDKLIECYAYMEKNPNIAVFGFFPTDDCANVESKEYPGFEKRPQNGEYRLNCQIALWNREKLISYIRPHENPWEWELYGSRRSSRYNEEFYSLKNDEELPFKYSRGAIIMRGRWWLEYARPLNEKYGLDIDFSKRGSFEELQANPQKRKRNLFRGIKNRINKIRSLI